jgi:hypothetical protein
MCVRVLRRTHVVIGNRCVHERLIEVEQSRIKPTLCITYSRTRQLPCQRTRHACCASAAALFMLHAHQPLIVSELGLAELSTWACMYCGRSTALACVQVWA